MCYGDIFGDTSNIVYNIDPRAFVTITEVHDIIGAVIRPIVTVADTLPSVLLLTFLIYFIPALQA